MANVDVSRGLAQLTGYYKGKYYENGIVRSKDPNASSLSSNDDSLSHLFHQDEQKINGLEEAKQQLQTQVLVQISWSFPSSSYLRMD